MIKICPKCKLKNFGEDSFCEKCLCDLISFAPQDYFARHMGGFQ